MKKIYLDNNATTGVDPRVIEAVHAELAESPSNPSSAHELGQAAKKRLLQARETIASFFEFKPHEVIFTSGGTESLNMLLRGIKASHILSSDIDHAAVYETQKDLEKKGTRVTYLCTGPYGAVRPEEVEKHLRHDTDLLVFSAANSETGVKNDIEAIAALAATRGIPLIVDGVGLLGKEPFFIPAGVAAIAFSGHKLHAPKGTGLALIRSNLKVAPLMTGGEQEYAKRAGTENLPGIMGLAKAVQLLSEELPSAAERMRALRDHFEETLQKILGDVPVNGEGPRIPNTTNLSFLGVDGETLLIHLDRAGIAASHGSACSSGALEPSRVLTRMGLSNRRTRTAVRFSLSRWTTREEIDGAIRILSSLIPELRAI